MTRIISEAHGTARRILSDRHADLESVTRRLLDIEVMEGAELRRLLGVEPNAAPSHEKTPLPPTDSGISG